jgi:hypothetical protein
MSFVGWVSKQSTFHAPVRPDNSIKEIKKEIESAFLAEHVADSLRPFVSAALQSKKYKI